jgi:cytochrome c-type biogenesis protein CcmH
LEPSLASKVGETNVVYIIARSADMPGPPLAVQQLRNIRFPYQYTLGSADLMMQGGSFQGRVNIVVRLDRDGAAGPPQSGDMEGVYAGNPATVGDQKVDVVINKVF